MTLDQPGHGLDPPNGSGRERGATLSSTLNYDIACPQNSLQHAM